MSTAVHAPARPSAWAPFTSVAFALLWTATLISNVGTWMHDVGAGWLMTTLSPSPAIVALVQASTTFPIFLFALLAGALADRLDRKRMLIAINTFLFVVIASLALLVQLERISPGLLLAYTLLIGTGAAFMAPAWQAVVPSLVPKTQLQSAIALNSMGINISRAIGPALAGYLITAVSLSAPFAVNAASHVVIVVALLLWKQPARTPDRLPAEPIVGAMVTGLRHAANNLPLRSTMIRALAFFLPASAYWAMLPLIARNIPGGGAELYGILLAAVGGGAVAGALLLPPLRRRISPGSLVAAGTVGTAAILIVFAVVDDRNVLIVAALVAGLSWITVLTCLNVSAQTALPNWVRARGLAVYLMVFFGSMALGATVWGQVASQFSVSASLIIASVSLVLAIPLTWRSKLGTAEAMDLSPSTHWPDPVVSRELTGEVDRGPVMVTVNYRIDPEDRAEFLAAIHRLSKERYRDGAFNWGVYQDTEHANSWLEWFMLPSWSEHLRQHQRVTVHDREIQQSVAKLHKGEAPPTVRHYLAPTPDSR
jgi:MFS family permease